MLVRFTRIPCNCSQSNEILALAIKIQAFGRVILARYQLKMLQRAARKRRRYQEIERMARIKRRSMGPSEPQRQRESRKVLRASIEADCTPALVSCLPVLDDEVPCPDLPAGAIKSGQHIISLRSLDAVGFSA